MSVKNKTEEFINKARSKHGPFYGYAKVIYVGYKNNVCIVCPKHGEFRNCQ